MPGALPLPILLHFLLPPPGLTPGPFSSLLCWTKSHNQTLGNLLEPSAQCHDTNYPALRIPGLPPFRQEEYYNDEDEDVEAEEYFDDPPPRHRPPVGPRVSPSLWQPDFFLCGQSRFPNN